MKIFQADIVKIETFNKEKMMILKKKISILPIDKTLWKDVKHLNMVKDFYYIHDKFISRFKYLNINIKNNYKKMSININIFFSLFITIINIPSPIKINSHKPFYITSNEILFQFEYKSDTKTDIICYFKPYLNELILGKMYFFTNLTNFQNLENEKGISMNDLVFDAPYSRVFNSTNI